MTLISSQLCASDVWQEVGWFSTQGLMSRNQDTIQAEGSSGFRDLLQAHRLLAEFTSLGCRVGAPAVHLAGSWDHCQLPEAACYSSPCGPRIACRMHTCFLPGRPEHISLTPPVQPASPVRENSLLLKGSGDQVGPTSIICLAQG